MKGVTGIGGVFIKARDPEALAQWYQERLGIVADGDGFVSFRWRQIDDPKREGFTAWHLFPHDTDYFEPSESPVMVNYRVDDLAALLSSLRAAGVEVMERIEDTEFGKFGWAVDPEGNKVELWEPPLDAPDMDTRPADPGPCGESP